MSNENRSHPVRELGQATAANSQKKRQKGSAPETGHRPFADAASGFEVANFVSGGVCDA